MTNLDPVGVALHGQQQVQQGGRADADPRRGYHLHNGLRGLGQLLVVVGRAGGQVALQAQHVLKVAAQGLRRKRAGRVAHLVGGPHGSQSDGQAGRNTIVPASLHRCHQGLQGLTLLGVEREVCPLALLAAVVSHLAPATPDDTALVSGGDVQALGAGGLQPGVAHGQPRPVGPAGQHHLPGGDAARGHHPATTHLRTLFDYTDGEPVAVICERNLFLHLCFTTRPTLAFLFLLALSTLLLSI
mmetsp:Transcript_8579/g.13156  ORF Transcript_8579/g.13156 Transcript_8579/m.13156 type:complete len:243 (+) Transcript_8579:1544-2272(+)